MRSKILLILFVLFVVIILGIISIYLVPFTKVNDIILYVNRNVEFGEAEWISFENANKFKIVSDEHINSNGYINFKSKKTIRKIALNHLVIRCDVKAYVNDLYAGKKTLIAQKEITVSFYLSDFKWKVSDVILN